MATVRSDRVSFQQGWPAMINLHDAGRGLQHSWWVSYSVAVNQWLVVLRKTYGSYNCALCPIRQSTCATYQDMPWFFREMTATRPRWTWCPRDWVAAGLFIFTTQISDINQITRSIVLLNAGCISYCETVYKTLAQSTFGSVFRRSCALLAFIPQWLMTSAEGQKHKQISIPPKVLISPSKTCGHLISLRSTCDVSRSQKRAESIKSCKNTYTHPYIPDHRGAKTA